MKGQDVKSVLYSIWKRKAPQVRRQGVAEMEAAWILLTWHFQCRAHSGLHNTPLIAASHRFPTSLPLPPAQQGNLITKNKGPAPGPGMAAPTTITLVGMGPDSTAPELRSSQPTSQHVSSGSYGEGGKDREAFATGNKVLGGDGEQARRIGCSRRKN